MTDIYKSREREIGQLLKKYKKEVEQYEKIGNQDNFEKIIEILQSLRECEVTLDSFYEDEAKMYGMTKLKIQEYTFYFSFFDFYGWDASFDMKRYLEGSRYNLTTYFEEEFIDFDTLAKAHYYMKKLKVIIDGVVDSNL